MPSTHGFAGFRRLGREPFQELPRLERLPAKFIRLATVRDRTGLSRSTIWRLEFPNFFEGWFTAETLAALRDRWPSAKLTSNANHGGFQKPDVVIQFEEFTAVLALKHIATLHPDAQSRWDGAKGSTVAKDIEGLRKAHQNEMARRALVFYGPGYRVAHGDGGTCDRHKLLCVACSVQRLSRTLAFVLWAGNQRSDHRNVA